MGFRVSGCGFGVSTVTSYAVFAEVVVATVRTSTPPGSGSEFCVEGQRFGLQGLRFSDR
jgi:hypothetical protein